MNQLDGLPFDSPIPFHATRARSTDGDTSHAAAKHAATLKSQLTRALLSQTIRKHDTHSAIREPSIAYVIGWTAKELSEFLDIPLADCYRRLPECGGIKKSQNLRRDGCVVWIAA